MTVNKAIDFHTFSSECDTIRSNLVTKGAEVRAAAADHNSKLATKTEACKGFFNYLASKECEAATKAYNAALDTVKLKNQEYATIEAEWSDAGCQASDSGCSIQSYNFKDCWNDVNVILSCSENDEATKEKCCILDRKIQYYGDLETALNTRIGQNSACLSSSNKALEQAVQGTGIWGGLGFAQKKDLIWGGIKDQLGAFLNQKKAEGLIETVDIGSNSVSFELFAIDYNGPKANDIGLAIAQGAWASAVDPNTIANILGIFMPTLDGAAGISSGLAPKTVVCGPIPSIDTTHFCFSPEEAEAVNNAKENLNQFIRNQPESNPEFLCRQYSQPVRSPGRKSPTRGAKFVPGTWTSKKIAFWDDLASKCYENASKAFRDINAAQHKRALQTIELRNDVRFMKAKAEEAKAQLLEQITKDGLENNAKVEKSVQQIIQDSVVASTTFAYKNKEGRVVAERYPKEGFSSGGYIVVDQGVVQLDVEAIENLFPADDAIELPNTAKQLNGTAELGTFIYPVTVNTQVKIDIPEEKLEALRDTDGLNKLNKSTQDSIINGLKALSCGTELQYCIGQSIE